MSTLLEEIRQRRTARAEQAMAMLEMVPLSDAATRYSLLSTAGHYLNDTSIKDKWVELAATETDTRLKADMLQRLAMEGWANISNKEQLLNLLLSGLQQDEARDIVLYMLGQWSLTDKRARTRLMEFYQQQNNAGTSSRILSWLLVPTDADEADIAFYISVLNKISPAEKLVLVNRLLLQNRLGTEQLEKLLQPEEPAAIKEMVLRYCLDRSVVPEAALCNLAKTDPSPMLRSWSIQLLALAGVQHAAVTDTLLQAATHDPDAGVQQTALRVFEYSLTLTPENIDYFCRQLLDEKHAGTVQQLLRLLAPYTAQSEPLCQALLQLLEKDIQTPLATALYHILGRLLPTRPQLFGYFLAAYEKEQHDDCKTAILQAITRVASLDTSLNSFYLKAAQAPSPAIREWGIRGILLAPLTEENTALFTEAAPVLLQANIHAGLRLLLAKKISCIPRPNAAVLQVFSRLADHETDENIRAVCTRVQEKAIAQSGGENINWEQWLHKAEVEHDLSGIFPHIWLFYQDHPQMAQRILWSALNPANSSSLYQAGVSDVEILRFLYVHAGVDDNMSRYALNQLLHTDLGNESKFKYYLLILKGNPSFAELQDGLWQLLEKRGSYINLIQLDELNTLVWGTALETIFRQHMLQQTTAAGLLPYLRYLAANNSWQPVPDLLKAAVQLPGITGDRDVQQALQECCRHCGIDLDTLLRTAAAPAPGFADAEPGFAD